MAQIRRSIFWAAHPFVVLVSFLFSVIHLGPPAWAKADGNTEPRQDEVTALIGELCENERFDHRISEELRRLQSGTQDLAQADPETIQDTISGKLLSPAPYLGPAAPGTMELVPLDELAPPPDVLLRQQPGAQMQQQPSSSAQSQQAYISKEPPDWVGGRAGATAAGGVGDGGGVRTPTSAQPQLRPGATAQPQQAIRFAPVTPAGQPQNQPALKVQPKQAPLRK